MNDGPYIKLGPLRKKNSGRPIKIKAKWRPIESQRGIFEIRRTCKKLRWSRDHTNSHWLWAGVTASIRESKWCTAAAISSIVVKTHPSSTWIKSPNWFQLNQLKKSNQIPSLIFLIKLNYKLIFANLIERIYSQEFMRKKKLSFDLMSNQWWGIKYDDAHHKRRNK